jgi:parallel beta-helix repeat protein
VGGFNWQVDLTHSELPSNVSGSLEPIQVVPTDSSIFRIYVTPDATPGIHSITFTATGGEILREEEMVLGILAPHYYGPVWHISPAGYDLIGNGSEEYPFRTIQKGINIADHGDTVLAQIGEYVANIDFSGKAILAASYFIFDSLESTIEATVINGNGSGSVVTFQSGEDSNSVIQGFTLTGGYASYGGGIRCHGSSPTIVENFMVDNECFYNRGGPAIYCGYGSNPRIYKNLITDCTGPAAVFLHVDCDAQVINNTVCNNSWGGMSIQGNSDPYVKNNIFYNNHYYGIHSSGGSGEILYNDVYGSDNNYLEIADQTGTNGNISTDPLFFDIDIGDYHLAPGSPCIDTGDPADSVPPGGGIRIDMGAFEFIYGPYVFYHSHQIDDSGWNNNGVVNPGEVVAMSITAINNGTEAVYNVSGILREDDDFVVVTDSVKEYGDLEPQMTAESMGNYWFEVDSSCSTFHPVSFTLELSDGSSVWRSTFVEMVIDTDFVITFERSPARVSPGDSLHLEVMVNTIGGFASPVNLSHSELPTGVNGVLDPDNLIPLDSPIFKISTTPDAPTRIHNVTITATGGGITHQKELELAILDRGDANVDGVVEVGDVVYLLNYLYKGGPPPYVWEAGDVNADSGIDIGDVVYLICYLFRNCAPPPPGKVYEPQISPQKTTVRQTSVKLRE